MSSRATTPGPPFCQQSPFSSVLLQKPDGSDKRGGGTPIKQIDVNFQSQVFACALRVRDYLLTLDAQKIPKPFTEKEAGKYASIIACKFVLAAIQSPKSQKLVREIGSFHKLYKLGSAEEDKWLFQIECMVFAHFGYGYICGDICNYRKTFYNQKRDILEVITDVIARLNIPTPGLPTTRSDEFGVMHRDSSNDKIGALLGRGGYGNVCLVERNGPGTDAESFLARKSISCKDNDSISVALIREVYMLRELRHPNITQMNAAGFSIENRAFYIYMDVMFSLLQVSNDPNFRQTGHPTRVLYVSKEIVRGLVFLHSEGIVHLDIKPENILCTTTGGVKLADFGISAFRPSAPIQYGPRPVGTPTYRSPELFDQRQNNTAVQYDQFKYDMWSMGVVLYELACGGNLIKYPSLQTPSNLEYYKKFGVFIQMQHIIGEMPEGYIKKFYLDSSLKSKLDSNPRSRQVLSKMREQRVSDALIQVVDNTLKYEPEERWTSSRCLECLDTDPLTEQNVQDSILFLQSATSAIWKSQKEKYAPKNTPPDPWVKG
jgi:serine/threonine protein kinase